MDPASSAGVEGLIEIRHAAGSPQASYEALYRSTGLGRGPAFVERLLSWLDVQPGQALLDVACGEGALVSRAWQRGLEAHGVDFARAALRRVQAGHVVVANGEALPYADNSFDRVASIGSLEHYERPLVGARELARVLRPQGLALVLLPNAFGLRWNVCYVWRHGDVCDDGQPIQRYGTVGQWSRLLSSAGLVVQRIIGWEGELERYQLRASLAHPTRWLVPLARWLPASACSLLVFICRKAAGQSGQGAPESQGPALSVDTGEIGQ